MRVNTRSYRRVLFRSYPEPGSFCFSDPSDDVHTLETGAFDAFARRGPLRRTALRCPGIHAPPFARCPATPYLSFGCCTVMQRMIMQRMNMPNPAVPFSKALASNGPAPHPSLPANAGRKQYMQVYPYLTPCHEKSGDHSPKNPTSTNNSPIPPYGKAEIKSSYVLRCQGVKEHFLDPHQTPASYPTFERPTIVR